MKKLIILLLVVLPLSLLFWYNSFSSNIINTESKIITIEKGENLQGLGKHFPMNPLLYKVYLKLNPPDFSLEAGKYKIEANANIAMIFENLQSPLADDGKITILEGWNIYDIDEYLSDQGYATVGEYTNNTSELFGELQKQYSFLTYAKSLEGFLYPDTYQINPNTTRVEDIIKKQLDTFKLKVFDKLGGTCNDIPFNNIIILASIVEKEEKDSSAKPIVAGILKKRLKEGWMLGADATVCYPHKLTSEECKMVVSKYIYEENGYNTRTMKGLPETPISNPSSETIFATIQSKETPYYFYLHGNDGEIHYAITNEEHETNKDKYIK